MHLHHILQLELVGRRHLHEVEELIGALDQNPARTPTV